ncbi:SGNH/GDSL hydrolase family protein [Actinomadura rubrisoli]|uniref:SGNH/GDSL hydrolase family protein n=2 Tax=Actinomadura rubrisoli TaxID=2530368 RepID=A0A4R5CEF6_9ACTN|nr:SGNH/GDSL hydrolase family protein [Actinomadura rubrisoli]
MWTGTARPRPALAGLAQKNERSYFYLVTTAANPLTEESDPFCLSAASAAQLLDGAPWRRFATIGDSLSAGIGDPSPGYATLGWPDRVADVLRRVQPDLAYVKIAEIGATTARTLETQMDQMIAFGPDLLHLPNGANDLFRPEPDFDAIERSLRSMFKIAAGTGAQLTTFALGNAFVLPKFQDWWDRVRRLNAIIRELALEHDAVLVDMWEHPINSRPNLLSADRIHFSVSGHAVLASEVVKGLAGALGTTR